MSARSGLLLCALLALAAALLAARLFPARAGVELGRVHEVELAPRLASAIERAEPDLVLVWFGTREDELPAGWRPVRGAVTAVWLAYVIAGGVGLFAALALLRVLWGVPMAYVLAGAYALMLLLSLLAPAELVSLAYDAGSVTTGVLSAPVMLAVALGLSSVLGERSVVSDGFGLLGLASTGPIIAILLIGLLRP